MKKSVSEKMGIEKEFKAIFINAPPDAIKDIQLPEHIIDSSLSKDLDHIHLFALAQAELQEQFPRLKNMLKSTGNLWVS